MREIKFRAWVEEKGMYDVAVLDLENDYVKVHRENNGYIGEGRLAIGYTAFMQYTGLKDFVGTEIYEGDIGWDAHQEVYGKVVFEDGGFRYSWANISEELFEVCEDIEIVGNIYENSELLEAEK